MSLSSQDWRRIFELLDGVEEPQREAWLRQLEGEKGPITDKLLELMSQRMPTAGAAPGSATSSASEISATSSDETLVRPVRPTSDASLPTASAQPSNTDSRWDSPHTWTGVSGESVQVGTVLSGRYLLERVLGEGGMGTVFLAQDQEENQPFAIKVMKQDFAANPDALKTLREEVIKSRELRHENIVGVYALSRDRNIVYVQMEYLQGKSLGELLDDDFARGMAFDQAWPIIQGAGAGLSFVHNAKGYIHSDIKPSNIFVTTAGKAKLLDFGIARALRGRASRYDPGELGALTPAYASCEMLEHETPDVRDDVYSFACVVYELLTGKHPFARQRAIEARDNRARMAPVSVLSRRQNAALGRALSFQRATRTPSIEAFVAGLRDKQGQLLRVLVRGVAAAAVLAAILSGGWLLRERQQGHAADEAYIASLLQPNAERSRDYDPAKVSNWLGLGDDLLAQSQKVFDEGYLSEGVANAFDAYKDVLRLDPANRKAAEGALAVVRLYLAKAKSLEREHQYKRALELVTIAQRLAPEDKPLRELKEELGPKAQSPDR
jgi:serine/threonine protein kinase